MGGESAETMNNVYEEVEQADEGEGGKQEKQEEQKTVEELNSAKAETGKINDMLEKLNKNIGGVGDSLELVCRGLNESFDGSDAKFEVLNTQEGKQELGLVVGEGFEGDKSNLLDSINSSIIEGDSSSGIEGGYFVDKPEDSGEQGNLKYDSGEFAVGSEGNIESFAFSEGEDNSYTDIEKRVEGGEEVTEGKYFEEAGSFYYEVGNEGDPGAAILRQLTVLGDELGLDFENYSDAYNQVENLYYSESSKEFFDSNEAPEGAKKVGNLSIDIDNKEKNGIDALNYMIQPGDKINISSLAEALNSSSTQEVSGSKEDSKSNESLEGMEGGWGNFFVSGGVEHWDLPDSKDITYESQGGNTINTNGNNLEITAKNLHDMESGMESDNLNENKFSEKKEVTDDGNTVGYLVIGESTSFTEKDIPNLGKGPIDKSTAENIDFSGTGVEAWLATNIEDGMNIKEVGDKNAHEFVRTKNSIESGKSANNPIYLDKHTDEEDGNKKYNFETTGENGEYKDVSIYSNDLPDKQKTYNEENISELLGEKGEINDIFENTDNGKGPLFFEFGNMIDGKDSKDGTFKFEKNDDGNLEVSKVSLESSGKLENQELLNRSGLIKESKEGSDSTFETREITGNEFGTFGSFDVNINNQDETIDVSQGDINFSIEGHGKDLSDSRNIAEFFDNGGFLKSLIGASIGKEKPDNEDGGSKEVFKQNEDGSLVLDYDKVSNNFSEFRDTVKDEAEKSGQELLLENFKDLGVIESKDDGAESSEKKQHEKINELKEKSDDIVFSELDDSYIGGLVSELNNGVEKGNFSYDTNNNEISYSREEKGINETFEFGGDQTVGDFKSWISNSITLEIFTSNLENEIYLESNNNSKGGKTTKTSLEGSERG